MDTLCGDILQLKDAAHTGWFDRAVTTSCQLNTVVILYGDAGRSLPTVIDLRTGTPWDRAVCGMFLQLRHKQ